MIKAHEDGKLILKILIIGVFALLIIGYGLFQAKKIISGPQISVTTPLSGSTVSESEVSIAGLTQNISAISLNDRPIFIDESGNFSEKLMLYPGYNIIKLKAEDKFGAVLQKDIELVYKQTS